MSDPPERPTGNVFGPPGDDSLASRIFPALPGTVKWGLERSERMLASLGDPHRVYPVLHVGGTNGKGSVARIWASVLHAAGFRTGLYTSPHLVSFRERVLVDGEPLPDDVLVEWSRDLRPLLVRESPSFFEAATVLAFLAFARAEVEVAVVEVGMGGRLDATNVVTPVLTAITNVGMDHAAVLGDSLTAIAREKAGILKPGVPVFTAADDPAVLAVLADEAAQREAILRRVPSPEGSSSLDGSTVRLETSRWGTLDLTSPLVGAHQRRNLALAIRALEALPPRLPVSARAVREGASEARVPGRFQVERLDGAFWILDVAHNPEGMEALARTLEALHPPAPRTGIVSILADKPWRDMIERISPMLDRMILTVSDSAPASRRWDVRDVAAALDREVEVAPDVRSAVELVREAADRSGTVVVTGSTYTVGDVLDHLGRIPAEALPVPIYPG